MATRSLGKLTLQIMAETGQFRRGLTDAEKAVDALTNKQKQQEKQLDRLINAIDPVAGEYIKLDKQLQQLQQHHKDGLLGDQQFDYYKTKLHETRKALGETSKGMDANGLSAKQMAFAMRGLPAQFTDIAVSLQGGQNPMTVFLQQGGQIKDMFGGIGPAAKAMGTYIAGLVNPFTVSAAAAAVLGLAYYQGSKEADGYRNAIILTGNAAGTSANQMADSARRISQYTGTQHQAAAALTEVANSGKFVGEQLEQIARIAALMENTTGKAVSETVKEFESLAKSPSKSIVELNDKYHFLTAAVYEQISALEKQGQTTEAAQLAYDTYANAMSARTKEITNNLGFLEKSWKGWQIAASKSWDWALNIGRDDTDLEKLADLNEQINELVAKGPGQKGEAVRRANELKRLQAEAQLIVERLQKEENVSEEQSKQAKAVEDSIKAQQELNKLNESGLTKEEKHAKALADMYRWVNAIKNADPASAFASDEAVARYKKIIDDQFKDKPERERSSDAGQKMLERLQQQETVLKEQLGTNEKLGTSARDLLQFNQRIADLKEKKVLTADDKSVLANEAAVRAQLEKNKALEEEIAKRDRLQKMQAYIANLDVKAATARQQNSDNLQGYGLGTTEAQRRRARQSIEREVQSLSDKTFGLYQLGENNGGIGEEDYLKRQQALQDYLNERLTDQQNYYDQLDAMRGDWQNGAKTAFANYVDSAKDVASQTENLFNNAFSSMEDAIVQFAMTGKLSFSDFTKSILADLARIAMRQAIVNMLSSFFGYSSGGAVGGTTSTHTVTSGSATYGTFDTGGYTGHGGKYQPAGIVHKGEVVFSQEDVARNGGVASVERIRKGYKGYADGGVVGGNYAAVTPTNNSQSVSITQQINVSNDNGKSDADNQKLAKAYAKSADDGAKERIAKELQPGGMIWRAQRGFS